MMPIKDHSRKAIEKSKSKLWNVAPTPWGTCGRNCWTGPVDGFLDKWCKGSNLFRLVLSVTTGLIFVHRPYHDKMQIQCNKWWTTGSYFILFQQQALPTGIKKTEPSISAVLHVGTLRRLGGIPCSLGRPPFRKRYERGLCFVLCAWQNGTAVARVIILYLVLVSCRLLS